MADDPLREASETLRAATTEATADVADRLEEQADRIDDLVDADYDPDHGTLARLERKLSDVREDASEAVAERVAAALEKVREFRSTVEGV